MKWSWTYWAWEPSFLKSEAAQLLARSYPAVIAGRLVSFGYEPVSEVFRMRWVGDPSFEAPTLARLPRSYEWRDVQVVPEARYEIVEEEGALYIAVRAERGDAYTLVIS